MYEIRFGAVKELIAEKKYTEAYVILKTIDDPEARELQAKLEKLEPSLLLPSVPIVSRTRKPRFARRDAAIFFGFIVFALLVINIPRPTERPFRGSATPFPTDATPSLIGTLVQPRYVYVFTVAILRSCPQIKCASVKNLRAGDRLYVQSMVDGDGIASWYRVVTTGPVPIVYGYVNDFTFNLPPLNSPWLTMSTEEVATVIALTLSPQP